MAAIPHFKKWHISKHYPAEKTILDVNLQPPVVVKETGRSRG
jgi:hypothetical protein